MRSISTDGDIIRGFKHISNPLSSYTSKGNAITPKQWQCMYGMVASYGLRPH